MGLYGTVQRWAALYAEVTREHRDLRDQLRALVQAAHHGAHPEDVAAVRSALFAAHDPAA